MHVALPLQGTWVVVALPKNQSEVHNAYVHFIQLIWFKFHVCVAMDVQYGSAHRAARPLRSPHKKGSGTNLCGWLTHRYERPVHFFLMGWEAHFTYMLCAARPRAACGSIDGGLQF